MLKIILTAFMLPLLLFFGSRGGGSPNASRAANPSPSNPGESGTLQKMIVASGSATMDLDLNRINGISSTTGRLEMAPSRKLSELHLAVAPNSFFPVLVFNNVIVGDLPNMVQVGSAGSQVGLAVATTSCNNGDQPLDFFALPNTDHPLVPQNFVG